MQKSKVQFNLPAKWQAGSQNYSKIFLIFNLYFCSLLFALLFNNIVFAKGESISLTPLIKEITANPGETISGTVDVTNNSSDKIIQTFYPLARDFTSNDDPNDSAPKFFESTPDDYNFALAKWITFDEESYKVGPKDTVNIKYTISIPLNAEAGGHYAAVFASTAPLDVAGQNAVAISARIGSLILATVSGDIISKGKLTEFKTSRKIYQKPPIEFSTTIENTGNIHLKPSGTIAINNWKNAEISDVAFNDKTGSVLPKSKRVFSDKLDSIGYGKFTAVATLTALSGNGEKIPLTAQTIFWVLPITAIIITLIVIILLILFFRLWLKRHDRAVKKK
ncbi:MAG: hypothetical protein CEN91_370 [Candidatus Berkelbacteria bacterium Licking1014_85]|uniref:DUF916 domain-containing protein n=1 Tax=Candidatus Berkelbacteria bacterium Licking1014_85 TaxID=2017148 RepID=A0A554LIQ0_9BACT|nr:MAG: hypothetical protein CEN91_370 [Candidatus Berkelbacteria bacterium Licking1014_85]